MKKNVLAILASPRKPGNCELAARMISRRMEEPHELNLLRIADFRLELCRGCYMCLLKNRCVLKDDLPRIIEAITGADAYIIAAPTYCLGANASIKVLIDRILAFYSHTGRIWGKPAIGVSIAGIEGKEGSTKLQVDSFMRLFQMKIQASEVLYGAMPGEVGINTDNAHLIDRLAHALFGEPVADGAPRCPLCGGDTFRFYEKNRVRCMLCSNEGTVDTSGNAPAFHVARSSHGLMLSKEDALNHREWLTRMKEKYRKESKRLGEIMREYENVGTRIKPLLMDTE